MPEPLTRSVLIDAAAAQLRKPDDPVWFRRSDAARALDAVLPLIADAIQAKGNQMYDRDDLEDRLEDYQTVYSEAADDLADMVRSLMGADDD